MSVEFRVGDVFDRLAEIPDGSIDTVITSPPFLALRSYLPADHPDKHREIGSEATPADFLDTLLALTGEFGRVLAPHGTIAVELGDTYSGSGGAGGDYNDNGLRDGQQKFRQVGSREHRPERRGTGADGGDRLVPVNGGAGWPLAKSLTGIPTLYTWSLAYGHNLLNPETVFDRWRIRNLIVWARPNPPVGALGDKFRPATSYITVATKSAKRWFDLDAVRTEYDGPPPKGGSAMASGVPRGSRTQPESNPAGAPPLDWLQEHPTDPDGDWLWRLTTQPYPGSHYATFPQELPRRLIKAMCPHRVCTVCGHPSERITTEPTYTRDGEEITELDEWPWGGNETGRRGDRKSNDGGVTRQTETVGWTDCGCPGGDGRWRKGVVLDPFGGSGTTGAAAIDVGRDAILVDLDARNAELAQDRIGMFLEVDS